MNERALTPEQLLQAYAAGDRQFANAVLVDCQLTAAELPDLRLLFADCRRIVVGAL